MTQMDADEKDPRTFAIIGAAMDVHRRLGHGFPEAVYLEAFSIELAALCGKDDARVINYLKASRLGLGLLLNCGASRLEYKRLALSNHLRPSADKS